MSKAKCAGTQQNNFLALILTSVQCSVKSVLLRRNELGASAAKLMLFRCSLRGHNNPLNKQQQSLLETINF